MRIPLFYYYNLKKNKYMIETYIYMYIYIYLCEYYFYYNFRLNFFQYI